MSQEDFNTTNNNTGTDTDTDTNTGIDNNTDTYTGANTSQNMISKPDANPILAVLLTLFVFELGHGIINGQMRKWGMTLLTRFIGGILCCLPGLFIAVLSCIDAYQTAERLKSGESIPENEYSHPLLYKIVRIIDKTATCSRAELKT